MKVGESPPAVDSSEEISELIEVLHETGQRLEMLTAGEVDSVANRASRTVMLQRAQDELRRCEAAKQAAVLNALPAHVALLDNQGRIISVNKAWRRFPGAHAIHGPPAGLNYLEICDGIWKGDFAEARLIADGIRSVLSGSVESFSIEYPCHSPNDERWFMLTVTPLADDGRPNGAMVMHTEVTVERQTEASLRVSESRFRQMAENIGDVFFLQNLDGSQIFYISPAYELIWGRTCESMCANPAEWANSIHPDDREQVLATVSENRAAGFDYECRIIRPDGETRSVRVQGFPIHDDAGNAYRIAGVASDITRRKEFENGIRRLNRVYAVLSGINTLIVRVHDRDELFREACRIAVEDGGFKLSWIGVVNRLTMDVMPVASAGDDDGFLGLVRGRLSMLDEAPEGRGVTAVAAREKRPAVINDTATDPRVRHKEAHALRGLRSLVSLPLLIEDETVATFDLHAGEAGFFDEGEMKLLAELAANLSFALDHIEKGKKLDYLAYYDSITGLANRSLFLERLQEKLSSTGNDSRKKAVFVVDVERFKAFNDAFGRKAGDELLRKIAERLVQEGGGDASRFARIEADHFAVVASDLQNVEQVGRYVEQRLDATFRGPFSVGGNDLRVSVKVGIALFPDDGADGDTLLRNADAALKKAKRSNERYLFFNQAMTERVAERLSLENRLRQALDNGEFVLHYQPKVDLASGKVVGAEALIRWNDPRTGLVPPGMFIPILEETGLIHEVGRWALHTAIGDHVRWRASRHAVRVAVNVSPLQLRNRGFIAEIKHAIGVDADAAAGLELEITESMIMEDVKQSIAALQAIRAMGVSIAIDDFGTGFSSLGYLAKLPVDILKIDRSFVVEMTATQQGLALVSTIITLAHSLRLKVVAEGVETEEQSRLLKLLNCDEMQGFLFSKPVPREIFEARFLAAPHAASK